MENNIDKSNIILVGMPGCGKSTCGVLAAKALLKNFFDTDLLIQSFENKRLQDIIDEKGTEYFLNAEESAITSLKLDGTVIATGGSVIYSKKSMEYLKSMGRVIYLHLSYDKMLDRINNITTRGVVLKNGNDLMDMYNERLPLYEMYCDDIIYCDDNTIDETVKAIIKTMAQK